MKYLSMFLIFFFVFNSCYKKKKDTDNEEISVPKSIQLSEEDYEKYLYSKDPGFKKEVSKMEKKLKTELGVYKESFPTPPPGWNLQDALASSGDSPKIYRWIDSKGIIKITKERPPKEAKLLGWRYIVEATPTPVNNHDAVTKQNKNKILTDNDKTSDQSQQ